MDPEVVLDFFGVYLLHSINPRYSGRTYVGYTRDPTRRLAQHNRGTWAGGAQRTNNRGPWKMVMIIHGFPNNIAALRFEWAWQNPERSTRLRHAEGRKRGRRETELAYRLRVLAAMLRAGPWHRLPLVVRWLEGSYYQPFPSDALPPDHMVIKHGPVKSKNLSKKTLKTLENCMGPPHKCEVCNESIDKQYSRLKCTSCSVYFHINCLSECFLADGEYVPTVGDCPECRVSLLWGDLICNMKCGDPSERKAGSSEESDASSGDELAERFSDEGVVEMEGDDGL